MLLEEVESLVSDEALAGLGEQRAIEMDDFLQTIGISDRAAGFVVEKREPGVRDRDDPVFANRDDEDGGAGWRAEESQQKNNRS